MCESAVVIRKNKKDRVIMEEAARIIVDGRNVACFNILGEKTEFKNVRIAEMNLNGHKIVLEEI